MFLLSLVFAFFITVNSKSCPTRSFIEKSFLDAHIPGAAIVVVNTTDIIYQQAFGHRSFLPTKLMDVDESIFILASISKTFIAIAAMQLVESNRLDLDKDINHYLLSSDPKIRHPLYPTIPITLRHLLSHSASIGPNQELESTFFQPDDKALTETTLAEACFYFLTHDNSNWLPRPPGTVTYYSNVGSGLAALVIERMVNVTYEEYVRDKILKPLKIDVKKAAFRLSDIDDQTNLVNHYTFNSSKSDYNKFTPSLNITEIDIPNWRRIPFYSVSVYPAGLLRMSAHSLSVYLRMFMNNGSSIVRPDSIVQMKTIVSGVTPYQNTNTSTNESSFPTIQYGLIWNWQTLENGRRYLGHGGSMPSITHSMLMNEKGDRGFILLTNGDIYPNNEVSVKIYTALGKIRLALLDCFDN